jgi:hypothetical protein
MAKKDDVLLELVQQYDKIRTKYNQLGKDKDEVNGQIKQLLGDALEVDVPGYHVTYKYDKDKEVTSFDEEKFEAKDPKKYAQYQLMLEEIKTLSKKYTKTKTVPGARKLIVEAIE